MKRWEDMTRDELIDAVRREHGFRLSAMDEVKRLRAITKDKRDLMAIAEQLQSEVDRLSTQNETWFRHAYENQLRLKRNLKERFDIALDGLRLATLWLAYFCEEGDEPGRPVFDVVSAWEQATRQARGVTQ